MRLTFHGAAGQVTGSMFQITLDDGYNILVDCGLNYELKVKREHNAAFPFDPADIDVVLLTHAHLDHSGNIPTLYSAGFEGKVICTEPTWTLCELLLTDSASLEARRMARKHKSGKKKKDEFRLYGHGDVRTAVSNMVTVSFQEEVKLTKSLKVTFLPAGHILGASSIVLDIKEGSKKSKRLAFTGDLGNVGSLITPDPVPPENVDYLIMESTYGSRFHVDTGAGEEVLRKAMQETCIENRGRLVIPAFSVGRTQAILYTLNRLFKLGGMEHVSIFADSPMGITSSEIHSKYTEFLPQNTADFLQKYKDLFRFKQLYIIEDKEDLEHMEAFHQPCVIVSSAGMLEGGRIQKHVSLNLSNPKSSILIAGYCTPGTLGHQLLSGERQINIKGRQHVVFAKISKTDAFSAHPDQSGLHKYHKSVNNHNSLKTTYLVHGDEESLASFKNLLEQDSAVVEVPAMGDSFVV